ncbi:ES2 protein, putative [Plasmodium ovale wallikeri]|uniref:ES2 protein, putative n=1 Tax=Plasmodium ovale wallikeri TaxID=864142 RepID=A0A1A8YV25_PLAOA|nr:ES2 protein, putative [Plasmodium ovale wallikeri]SBT35403.1 ES2 protein, putative [Plasmodium ovale wallikeri]
MMKQGLLATSCTTRVHSQDSDNEEEEKVSKNESGDYFDGEEKFQVCATEESGEVAIMRRKKKRKKRNEKDEQNEKIVLFENNEIVEYDASNFGNGKNHIVLLEEDYLSVLEYLIEKTFFPDIKKWKEEEIARNAKVHEVTSDSYADDCLHIYSDSCCDVTKDLSPLFTNKSFHSKINIESVEKGRWNHEMMDVDKKSHLNDICPFDESNSAVSCINDINIVEKKEKNYKLVKLANGKKHKINLNINLSDFQKKYTSEDNKSFEYLIKNMKNKNMEKNIYSIIKRKKHNLKMDYIDEHTKKGINCNIIHTNKSEHEFYSMMFSSNFETNNVDNEKKKKIKICYDNTRFCQQYNEDMKKFNKDCNKIKDLKMFKNKKENYEYKMIEQGNFNLLSKNDQYEYVHTPIIQAGKGIDKSPIITWGKIMNTPKVLNSEEKGEDKNDTSSSYDSELNSEGEPAKGGENGESGENDFDVKNEFNLQKVNKREIIAEKLQNSLKNIKYNKEVLKKKNVNSLMNRNYSSRMSTTSFRNSVLSRRSQKRLNELAMKSSLASQMLSRKRKTSHTGGAYGCSLWGVRNGERRIVFPPSPPSIAFLST